MKKLLTNNVHDESVNRIRYVLKNFKRVYVSFSGGKDSGVMLNLVLRELRKNYPGRKVGLMTLDNEANYELSLQFMHKIVQENIDVLDVHWCCLPITLPCTVSSYEIDWQCWGENDKNRWVRPMPTQEYIVNVDNHKYPFFRENMGYQEFWDNFGEWYSQGEECACLIGIRTQESLNRWRAIVNENKQTHGGNMWTKRNTKHTYNCYPIYDWTTEDIWIANAKFEWHYNKLYDIFWKAGLTISQMRVASPFMSESKSSLNLYRIIDPHVWATLCARVNGANFAATYGKQLNYRSFTLPKGHTWKSFVKFLLATLPEKSAKNFKMRFIQSLKYWGRVGRGLSEDVIKDLEKHNVDFKINGKTAHGRKDKERVVIQSFPDHLDFLSTHCSDVASWKRFAITILKNDHTCKYLGLAPTKEQIERMKYIKTKYSKI
jgi:predicted phosphoadenosine phosphosulfate sulfurtransferase